MSTSPVFVFAPFDFIADMVKLCIFFGYRVVDAFDSYSSIVEHDSE